MKLRSSIVFLIFLQEAEEEIQWLLKLCIGANNKTILTQHTKKRNKSTWQQEIKSKEREIVKSRTQARTRQWRHARNLRKLKRLKEVDGFGKPLVCNKNIHLLNQIRRRVNHVIPNDVSLKWQTTRIYYERQRGTERERERE